ncbi:MAG: CRISPR-associated protein Cas6, partial [Kovacikia sp.]
MPHSLVLNLLPTSPIPSGYLTGKHLHALFLTLVSSVDKPLGDRLHEQKTDKAFTLSPLQVCRGERVMESKYRELQLRCSQGQYQSPPLPHSSTPPLPHSPTLQHHHPHPISAGTPCWWRISLLDDALFCNLTQLWL